MHTGLLYCIPDLAVLQSDYRRCRRRYQHLRQLTPRSELPNREALTMIDQHGNFFYVQIPSSYVEKPAFHFGQRVQLDSETTGTIFGLEFTAVDSYQHREGVDAGWHYQIAWDRHCDRSRPYPTEFCHQSVLQPINATPVLEYSQLSFV